MTLSKRGSPARCSKIKPACCPAANTGSWCDVARPGGRGSWGGTAWRSCAWPPGSCYQPAQQLLQLAAKPWSQPWWRNPRQEEGWLCWSASRAGFDHCTSRQCRTLRPTWPACHCGCSQCLQTRILEKLKQYFNIVKGLLAKCTAEEDFTEFLSRSVRRNDRLQAIDIFLP